MKRIVKKIVKGIGITIFILIALMIILPIIFKDKIAKKVKEEINNSVNAKVDYSDVSLSLFRNFPNFSLRLDNLKVIGIDKFDKDTLLDMKDLSLSLNLWSVIAGDQIKVKAIELNKPKIHVIVLKDRKANYDITKPDTVPATPEKESEPTKFKVSLKKIAINDAQIRYDDYSSAMFAKLAGFTISMKGDLTESQVMLNIKSQIAAMDFSFDGIKYFKKTVVDLDAEIDADMNAFKFTFKENKLKLNALELGFDGYVAMPDSNIDMDLKYSAQKTDFKNILSMVPGIYMKGYEDVKTGGKLALTGFLKGRYNSVSMPLFGVDLLIENGRFQYPALPKSAENIQVKLHAESKDEKMEKMDIDMPKCHVELGGNPFDMNLLVNMFPADMKLQGAVNGRIDLNTMKDVIPMEDMSMSGLITAAIKFAGNMSSIEKEKYDEFKAEGSIGLKDFSFQTKSLTTDVKIPNAQFNFTPQYAELSQLDVLMGKSDFHLVGKVQNYIPYIFKDGTINGSLSFTSNYLNVNELMSEDETPATTQTTDTVPLTAFEVPKNLDVALISNLTKVSYDKIDIENINGTIKLHEGKAILDNLKMNLLKGSMAMSGSYDSYDIRNPKADFDFDMNRIDIPAAVSSFVTIRRLAPIAKKCSGNISMKFKMNTLLDFHLSPQMKTLNANGTLKSDNIGINGSKAFELLGTALKDDKYKNPNLKDVNVSFLITNGDIVIQPFNINLGKTKMEISGTQNLDKSINFIINMNAPRSELGTGANTVVNNLISNASSKGIKINNPDEIKLTALVTGTITSPKLSLDLKEMAKKTIEDLKEQVKEKVENKVKEEANKLIDETDKKAKAILDEANKKAEILRKDGNAAIDKTKEEAYTQADNLVKEAAKKGPIAEAVAKKTAAKLKQEADKKAEKAKQELEKKVSDILEKAKQDSEKATQEARNKTNK